MNGRLDIIFSVQLDFYISFYTYCQVFNSMGWSSCTEAGYYIAGLYRNSNHDLRDIDRLRCCSMLDDIGDYSDPALMTLYPLLPEHDVAFASNEPYGIGGIIAWQSLFVCLAQ